MPANVRFKVLLLVLYVLLNAPALIWYGKLEFISSVNIVLLNFTSSLTDLIVILYGEFYVKINGNLTGNATIAWYINGKYSNAGKNPYNKIGHRN